MVLVYSEAMRPVLVYLHMAKTGGTSVERALKKLFRRNFRRLKADVRVGRR